jgi:hypothetical protein
MKIHGLFLYLSPRIIFMKERALHFKETLAGLNLKGIRANALRIDRMIMMVDHMDDHPTCPECRKLLEESEKWATTTHPDENFDQFEQAYMDLYTRTLNHLKENHGMLMPGYFRNLYGLIMMVAGTLAGILLVYMGRSSGLGRWSYETGILLGWLAGLVTGLITGHKKDVTARRNGKILFN